MGFYSDDLMKYLRPFAQEGKIVNEADIQSFFDALNEAKKTRGRSENIYAPRKTTDFACKMTTDKNISLPHLVI